MLSPTRSNRTVRSAGAGTGRCRVIKVFDRLAACLAFGLAASGMAVAAGNCTMVKVDDMPVRVERNHLIVDGTINGQKIGIMLDTGSMLSMIFRPAAQRLGLARNSTRGYRLFGIGGETEVESALVDEFKLGQAALRGWRLLVAGERELGGNLAFVLGEDFFYQVDVEFDLAHAAVRLFQSKDCEGASLAYWATEGAVQVDIEPIYEAQPQILLEVRINDQPVRALLDSGAATSVLDISVAARLGLAPDSPGVTAAGKGGGLGAKSVDYWIGTFKSVRIGNETIRDANIRFGDLWKDAKDTPTGSHIARKPGSAPVMLLGADFVRSHRVLVAHSQRKLYFTYAGGPVFEPARPIDTRSAQPAGATGEPRTDEK